MSKNPSGNKKRLVRAGHAEENRSNAFQVLSNLLQHITPIPIYIQYDVGCAVEKGYSTWCKKRAHIRNTPRAPRYIIQRSTL